MIPLDPHPGQPMSTGTMVDDLSSDLEVVNQVLVGQGGSVILSVEKLGGTSVIVAVIRASADVFEGSTPVVDVLNTVMLAGRPLMNSLPVVVEAGGEGTGPGKPREVMLGPIVIFPLELRLLMNELVEDVDGFESKGAAIEGVLGLLDEPVSVKSLKTTDFWVLVVSVFVDIPLEVSNAGLLDRPLSRADKLEGGVLTSVELVLLGEVTREEMLDKIVDLLVLSDVMATLLLDEFTQGVDGAPFKFVITVDIVVYEHNSSLQEPVDITRVTIYSRFSKHKVRSNMFVKKNQMVKIY